MAERDIEREEEVSRQRGYGEQFNKDEELQNQSTPTAGYKQGSPIAEQTSPDLELIVDMDDERVPNAPNDGTDDDSDAEIEQHDVIKAKPNEHLLEDAYSVPDPGVETKK